MDTYRDDALIGGTWVKSVEVCPVENPATETIIGTAASCTPYLVDLAVATARTSAAGWAAHTPAERAVFLDKVVEVLSDRRSELVDLTVAEVGAPLTVALESHVDLAIDVLASAAKNARAYPFEKITSHSVQYRRPVGVIACITPWNYPLFQLAAKVGPAMAAGCTVVLKPAELAPLSSYLFAEATVRAGLPAGVFNLVPGTGSIAGAALVEHPEVDFVSFTGSTEVGRVVAATAAGNLKRTCLELGGKSSSIVCADADLEVAVRATVDSAMLNSGQTCSAWTRLLVPADRYEEALVVAGNHARSLMVGNPRSQDCDLGPLISGERRDAVRAVIGSAVARGARVVAGAEPVPEIGYYVRPTVLADLDPADPASQSEIFGPVLVVHPYRDEREAVALANGTAYGLAGAVWAGTQERAVGIAKRLDAGQVEVNGAAFDIEAPFGGWKDSGHGRELGFAGLEEYTELTSVQF